MSISYLNCHVRINLFTYIPFVFDPNQPSFTEVLEKMRGHLKKKGFTQIPQLSSMNPIDVNHKFDLVPDTATGTRRAVMIGINYVGKLA